MSRPRHFAVVPAAGHSLRMGQPKLLLAWQGRTILDQVLDAWTRSRVSHVIVVVRHSDANLLEVCQRWPVEIVCAEPAPRDMKESVRWGLRHVAAMHQPASSDRWLVAPADLPDLSRATIDRLVAVSLNVSCVVVPRFGVRRGHPVVFPWALTPEVARLGKEEGIDRILDRHPVCYVDFPIGESPADVDTPEEYRRRMNELTDL